MPWQEIRSRRLDDAPQGKLVDDYEDDWYFPGQEPAQRVGVTAQGVIQTFAVGQPVTGSVLGEPVPVGLNRVGPVTVVPLTGVVISTNFLCSLAPPSLCDR